jgi:uncharacterized protein (DUF433 family)
VIANIHQFEHELARTPGLQDRLSRNRAWYAARSPNGSWAFGPSKFVGYQNNNGALYVQSHARRNGGATEAVMERWFDTVPATTRLGRELSDALEGFLARWNHTPCKSARINVLKSELDMQPQAPRAGAEGAGAPLSRIASDPRICGGRPCIKGTRMRVSDIVDMLAQGAAREEILEDFPYLVEEDIAAALAYAARATDHRVIRAA